jgi:hypothetical protein
MFDVRRIDRLGLAVGQEDLDRFVVVSDGTLVKAALDALVSFFFATFKASPKAG